MKLNQPETLRERFSRAGGQFDLGELQPQLFFTGDKSKPGPHLVASPGYALCMGMPAMVLAVQRGPSVKILGMVGMN